MKGVCTESYAYALPAQLFGIKEKLLDKQAASIGIKLEKALVKDGSNEEYEKIMSEKLHAFNDEDITHVIFGDIFLEDLRLYREEKLAKINLIAVYPLWKINTSDLVQEILKSGFETITCCVSTKFLNESFVGKKIDNAFLKMLPGNIDPCGENGEYHTFCYNGPIFKNEIAFDIGEKISHNDKLLGKNRTIHYKNI